LRGSYGYVAQSCGPWIATAMIKRIFLWFLAIIVVLVVAIVLAFRFTPWPSVAIIQQAFSRGDQASEAALEKHVPDNIVTRRDIAYGEGRMRYSTSTIPRARVDRCRRSSGCMAADGSPAARTASPII
jgi:hypothetical protein